MRPAGARRAEGNLLAEVCLVRNLSLTLRTHGEGSSLWKPLTAEVFGSKVSVCCCLFKEAGLYPEEAEKFRCRITGFRQLRGTGTYAELLRPELSRDRLDAEPPEVRRPGVRG